MIPVAVVLPFLKANWKIIVVGVVIAATAYAAYRIYDAGGDAREDAIVVESEKTVNEVEDAKDEIRSHRPDRRAVIDSLRKGTF